MIITNSKADDEMLKVLKEYGKTNIVQWRCFPREKEGGRETERRLGVHICCSLSLFSEKSSTQGCGAGTSECKCKIENLSSSEFSECSH